jgi:hypothetical protein
MSTPNTQHGTVKDQVTTGFTQAACQSQAPWATSWRHIPPADITAAQADAFRELKRIEGPGGTLTRTLTFACTTGTAEPAP